MGGGGDEGMLHELCLVWQLGGGGRGGGLEK